jgi:integrin beta 3
MGRDGRDGLPGLPGGQGEKGLDGKDGRDGVDGLGFDDLGVDYDGERTFTITFVRGEQTKRFPVTVPFTLYRGIWEEGRAYEAGDVVTWSGSTWVAKTATTAKPGLADEASRAWQLAVKSGRDGKTGPEGPHGPVGPRGEKGDRGPDRW